MFKKLAITCYGNYNLYKNIITVVCADSTRRKQDREYRLLGGPSFFTS